MYCGSQDTKPQAPIRFSDMGSPRHIWAIPSIHGDIDRLTVLHDAIFNKIQPGDRLIYLGNYTGYGSYSRETVDELLMFRRALLARPAMKADDLIYLRGKQEDLWQQLLQIQFQQSPVDRLLDLMGQGLSSTMQSYDICPHEGIAVAKEGTIPLTKWTHHVRRQLRAHPGHECFMTHQRRAAFTNEQDRFPLLFVNSGIDTSKPLQDQHNSFWEKSDHFEAMTESYAPFDKVVRGYDPAHKGLYFNGLNATLDGGCGFGGSLTCTQMSTRGEFFEVLEA